MVNRQNSIDNGSGTDIRNSMVVEKVPAGTTMALVASPDCKTHLRYKNTLNLC